MGPSPISASLGAMGSLPRKLDELLATKHRTLRGIVMDEIEQLTADLRVLHSFTLKLSNAQDPPTSARYWMKGVRELSYDMEDFADQFIQAHGRAKIYFLKRRHHAHGRAKIRRAILRKLISRMKDVREPSSSMEKFVDQFIHAHGRAKIRRATCRKLVSRLKISRLPGRRRWRPWITDMVSEFRTRAQEATRRYRRYKLDGCVPNPGYSPIGHELPTILQDPGDLVGIEGPMNELERWLINNGEEQLKVVSIVGVGGIGKTTLAQKLWGKLHVQFECGAFVRTAQKPDMRGILRNILLQVRPHQPPNAGQMRHLINDLREYLQGKRYLIIIDDLWSTSVWDVVSRAFPQSDCCSRIITTTEIMEVALACCCFFPEHIFKMASLGDNDSQKLLLQRILVSGNQSPQQFDDVIPQIVRSCGGLPLAIIIVARILASQPGKLQWGSAHNSFDSIFGVNPTMEGFMGQILNICFISLPHYLKTCLLYLSTYPEGYLFLKDDLVKQWVAEGFICANEGEDMEEVARRYFDALVSMGLIQVMDINCNYEMFSYSVHQQVLDLIKYKSIEENFITVLDYSQTTIPLNDKVRRLALHFGSATYATTPTSSRLSQVRSLFFSGLFNCMPSFVVFKLLRVLILHVWDDTGTTELNLTGICELLQLRYLQVTCNVIVKLPDRIAAMKHLETLEINARACDVPPDIVRLSSLLHLHLQGANLPSGIGRIRYLHTLMYFDLGNSSEDSLRGLGELLNLKEIHLTYSSSPSSEHLKRNLIALAASVRKLCNLKSLTLAPGDTAAARVILFDDSTDMSMPMFLERLELLPPICILSRLPKWIGQLRKICIVKVAVSELPTTDIAILTGLPSLTVLWLSVQTAPEGRTVFNNYAFPVLKYFKFSCGVLCMSFMAGAMPDLRRLKLVFNTHTGEAYDNMLAGIEHLLKLQDIAVQIGVTTGSDWRAAESAINEAIDKHPRSPGRNFQCVDPVAEEFRPSGKLHWSNEKSSLDEKPQDTVVQIGATTGSDWRTAESAINEAIDKHPRFPRRNFECVDPAAEEFRPSKKHQKSSLDEKLQDTVVEIGATTGSDWRAAESAINEDIDKHPRFPRRNLQCVDPVVEEFRPSKKHHWSNEESSLDEKLAVLEKSNDMNKCADSGPSQHLNLPSTVASGRQESGSSVEESKESPAPLSQVQEEKRMDRSVSFSTVIQEAMMKKVQNAFGVLEHLRRVEQEEIQTELVRSQLETPPAAERPVWRLVFLNPPMLPIFTGSKIEDVNGEPLQVILVDANTGSPCGEVAHEFMRVELVPLFGDFLPGGCEEWTAGEFARGIVKERSRKRPLLTGDVNLTMRDGRAVVNELRFTDNSSWVRCRKFRIGARVVPGGYKGARVAEAMTDAFNVRDHRGELYRKHYPPALSDDVWRLEKIRKEGVSHRRLRQHGVETVQEFLRMLMVKPDALRAIMGDGMTDRMWEVTTSHAKTCDAGDKVYAYPGQHGITVYVNSICQLVKIKFAGVAFKAQELSRDQKAYVHQLYVEAFEQRENLQEAEPATMLLHASSSSSSSSLPVLHNTTPVAPPPLPAIQGNPELDIQIVPRHTRGNPVEEDATAVGINHDETMFGSD